MSSAGGATEGALAWFGRALIGSFIALQFALTVYLLLKFFPTADIVNVVPVRLFPRLAPESWAAMLTFVPNVEHRLMIVMLLAGCLGSFTHVATSYTDYVGNRTFRFQWTWWYLLRMVVGGALALIFYFILRGGLVSPVAGNGVDSGTSGLNPYGLVAVGALAGMFSKQATDKLREVFDTLFKTTGDTRKDKLVPKLELTRAEISRPPEGGFSVVVTGAGFAETCKIAVANEEATMRFDSPERMTGTFQGNGLKAGDEVEVSVVDAAANGAKSVSVKAKVP